MMKAYKYRLYPTKLQEEVFLKHYNGCRFIYNLALETKKSAWESQRINLSAFDLINQLPELKEECIWLKEVYSQSLQAAIRTLDKSFQVFYKGGGYPKFKSKKDKQSFTIPLKTQVDFEAKRILLPKIGSIKFALDRTFEGKIKSAVISKSATGKHYISIYVETPDMIPEKAPISKEKAIGIDLGVNTYATLSDGRKIDNPAYLKKGLEKLRILNQQLALKKKGSGRWKKAKKQLSLHYEKIANQRNDFLHKVSTQLISENQTICLETLRIKNMLQNKRVAKSISDCSWNTFINLLTHKANLAGVNILRVDTFAPSSKTCSCCGHINKNLKQHHREWICEVCSTHHDRDITAAINIKEFAFKSLLGEITLSSKKSAICHKNMQKVRRSKE